MSYTYLCENSTCSPGQEAESLAELSSDTPQFALWKLSHTADASCSKDSATESCHDSQFGTTSPHSTPSLGGDGLTLCAEDSHAKTFPPLEKAQALTAREADCGATWPEWFAKFDPVTCSWKTRQCSLLAGLDAFSGTWPRWGMMRDGVCWEQSMQVRHIDETESGLWPTPTTRDWKGVGKNGRIREGVLQVDTLDRAVWAREGSGHLNPTWVEWLMGWPLEWTDSKPLVTDKFQQWPHWHGKY